MTASCWKSYVPAGLDDFLATPEMAAEYEHIRRLLDPA